MPPTGATASLLADRLLSIRAAIADRIADILDQRQSYRGEPTDMGSTEQHCCQRVLMGREADLRWVDGLLMAAVVEEAGSGSSMAGTVRPYLPDVVLQHAKLLPHRYLMIIDLTYGLTGEVYNRGEVARILKTTKERVRQMHEKAMQLLWSAVGDTTISVWDLSDLLVVGRLREKAAEASTTVAVMEEGSAVAP